MRKKKTLLVLPRFISNPRYDVSYSHQVHINFLHSRIEILSLRACINDVPKIKIGKKQNQNRALIGRGLSPPDYASLFFGNRCQTKEVPGDLLFIFRKINIGGVHLIEGFSNTTCQRPEASRVTTAARRQTEPPHNTHNFCWHGPRQRSHGEGNR